MSNAILMRFIIDVLEINVYRRAATNYLTFYTLFRIICRTVYYRWFNDNTFISRAKILIN